MPSTTLPETVTLSGEQVYRIAGLLLGIDEFFCQLSEIAPPREGDGFEVEGRSLWNALFGADFEEFEDEKHDRDPRVVDLWATGYEYAAKMLRGLVGSAEASGQTWGLYDVNVREGRALIEKLEAKAVATRLAGDVEYDRKVRSDAA